MVIPNRRVIRAVLTSAAAQNSLSYYGSACTRMLGDSTMLTWCSQIESMFRWYTIKEICYAFRSDVPTGAIDRATPSFREGKCFTVAGHYNNPQRPEKSTSLSLTKKMWAGEMIQPRRCL